MNDAIADFEARIRAAQAEAPPREVGEDKVTRPSTKTERELQLIAEFAAFDDPTKVTTWSLLLRNGSADLAFARYVHFLFVKELLFVFRDGVPDFLSKDEKVT